MSNETSIDENDVSRYLAGLMQPEEEAAFETAMLERPALLEAVALAQALRRGLREWSLRKAPVRIPAGSPAALLPARAEPTRRRRGEWLRLAAAVLLGAALPGAMVVRQMSAGHAYSGGQPVANVVAVTLGVVRSTSAQPAVVATLPAEAGAVVFDFPPLAETPDEPLQARLTAEGKTASIDVAGLLAGPDGYLSFAVPRARLAPGRWAVELRRQDGSVLARHNVEFSAAIR